MTRLTSVTQPSIGKVEDLVVLRDYGLPSQVIVEDGDRVRENKTNCPY